jgi:hypothetical protein
MLGAHKLGGLINKLRNTTIILRHLGNQRLLFDDTIFIVFVSLIDHIIRILT